MGLRPIASADDGTLSVPGATGLTDVQVRRYSRQILLRSVGGRGQEALLSTGARAAGSGPTIATTAAYLAAGGTPTWMTSGRVEESQVGFVFDRSDVGSAAPAVLQHALDGLNSDAAHPVVRAGQVSELPAVFEVTDPWIALGSDGPKGVCVLRSSAGCVDCFRAWTQPLQAPPIGPLSVTLGSLAALVFQRSVLGMEAATLRGWLLSPQGELTAYEGERCQRCR